MTAASVYDIQLDANESSESKKISCYLLNKTFAESVFLAQKDRADNQILHGVEKKVKKFVPSHKTKLELLEELGLIGCIESSDITSKNYKEHLRKSLDQDYEKR